MAKEFSKYFYNSKSWQSCRNNYINQRLNIDGGLCEKCKQNVGYIVHHITMLTAQNINDPSITLNDKNLEYVCKDCHDKEHYKDIHKLKKCRCGFNELGQPILKK